MTTRWALGHKAKYCLQYQNGYRSTKRKDLIIKYYIHLSSVELTTPNLRHSVPLRTPCEKPENNKSIGVRCQQVNSQIDAFQP